MWKIQGNVSDSCFCFYLKIGATFTTISIFHTCRIRFYYRSEWAMCFVLKILKCSYIMIMIQRKKLSLILSSSHLFPWDSTVCKIGHRRQLFFSLETTVFFSHNVRVKESFTIYSTLQELYSPLTERMLQMHATKPIIAGGNAPGKIFG